MPAPVQIPLEESMLTDSYADAFFQRRPQLSHQDSDAMINDAGKHEVKSANLLKRNGRDSR